MGIDNMEFMENAMAKGCMRLQTAFLRKGNEDFGRYYSKPSLIFSDFYSIILGRRLSCFGKFPQPKYDHLVTILSDAFSAQTPFFSSCIADNAVKFFVICLKLASSDKTSKAAYEAYNKNKTYYDNCYKEFLSYKPFTDFSSRADVVSYNFNYNAEHYGRIIFKIAIPHIYSMSNRIQADILSVVNTIHPSIGRFVKNTHSIDIFRFIDKYSLDYDTDPCDHDFIILCCAFRLCATAFDLTFDNQTNIDAILYNTDVCEPLIELITDMAGHYFASNRKYIPAYNNAPAIALSYSEPDYTGNKDMLHNLFEASLSISDYPDWFKVLLSKVSSDILSMVNSVKWDLTSFIDMTIECFYTTASVLPPFSRAPLTDNSQDKLIDTLTDFFDLWLICPSLDFIPSQYACKQAIEIPESSILETFCLAVNNFSFDLNKMENLDSVDLWDSFTDFVFEFANALISRIAFKDYFELRNSARIADLDMDLGYEEEQDAAAMEYTEPVMSENPMDSDSSIDYLETISRLKSELARKDKMLSAQAHENAQLEKENEKLRNIVSSMSVSAMDPANDKPELIQENAPDIAQMSAYINSLGVRIFIVGGHDSTNRRLSEILDNLTCTSSDKFDEKLIWSNDFIFINSSFLNHHIYYKVDRLCEKAGKPYNYLKGSNVYMSIEKIYSCVKEAHND